MTLEFYINLILRFQTWLKRKHHRLEYLRAYRKIRHARIYLEQNFLSWASNQSRGYIMLHQELLLDALKSKERTLLAKADRFLYENN